MRFINQIKIMQLIQMKSYLKKENMFRKWKDLISFILNQIKCRNAFSRNKYFHF